MKFTTNPGGSVLYQWVKLGTSNKGSKFYQDSPGYKLISKDSTNSIFAFKRVVDLENPLPHHLDYCSDIEVKKLENQNY